MTPTLMLFAFGERVTLVDGPAPLRLMLLVHVLAAAAALVTGYVALYAGKGSPLHRKSGRGFVYAMVTMGTLAAVINLFEGEDWSEGLLVAYFAVSAMTTVQPPSEQRRWLQVGCMLVAAFLGVSSIVLGIDGMTGGEFPRERVPAPLFLFGTITLLAAVGDVRVIRAGALHGRPRLVRHLWRMCFALFIAAGSFFIGQSRTFPEPLRNPAVMFLPVLVPLLAMPYWIWRLRSRRPARVVVSAGEGGLAERATASRSR